MTLQSSTTDSWQRLLDPAVVQSQARGPLPPRPALSGSYRERSYPSVAARPAAGKLPGVGMVVVITVAFGAFGLIPATRRANRAGELGRSGDKYWQAFWVTFGVTWFVFGVLPLLMMIA
ncbi:hypothetical protein [Actinoplanes awajinensis]|uniref:Uncharacterized protein n=1 Tax=Actinoplanes awajinensis subsp. mycoplanecinus TaxID=135947 RepID=A0A0X3VBG2_9ACTN|nr:hypothetical protein [Actinoplanes awajinensis]KUL42141.1 hypothetical protein ADL15_01835 [Actinoplanes awajinensis subsp. mycoplanecinus]